MSSAIFCSLDRDNARTSQVDEFTYWNFFLDWGPLSLNNLYRFCRALNFKLRSDRLKEKVKVADRT